MNEEGRQPEQMLSDDPTDLETRCADLKAQLEASNNELKEFAYIISHDLRAPLRAVSQLAGWIANDYSGVLDEEGKDLINLLLSRIDRMEGLIQGILEYSRIGRVKEKGQRVDLNSLLGDVVDTISPPEGIQVIVETQLPTIMFEYEHAEQMFQHLVDNAVKFMDKPEGEIRIRAEDGGDHWKFSVADNGPGIDPTSHDKIFQIFQTLSPRDESESTGIGLTLVKKIVDTSGGDIWVESEVGAGTTFFLTLPKKGDDG